MERNEITAFLVITSRPAALMPPYAEDCQISMSIISCLEFLNSLLMDLPAVTLDSFIACSKQDSRDPLLLKAIQWLISEYKSKTLPWFSIPDLSCYPSSLSLCPSQLASCGLGKDTPAVGILHWLFPPGTLSLISLV